MGEDYAAVAEEFISYYYSTFDADRRSLEGLYRPTSLLTFESSQSHGTKDIVEKLASLPFQKVEHQVTTNDAQPLADGGIIVMVTGALIVDDSPAPVTFVQTFVLMPEGGAHYVGHDIFKLIYPA
ncbi:MAG TPA: nuclear transport factor 2 family protein [Nonomuraea sp.]|nr:nuclear transport factor 2 family protein [Nonomuraea sp.]